MKKAVILLSGGLDSASLAAIAKKDYLLYGLSFAYGQRHEIELEFAKKLADFFAIAEHKIAKIDLGIFGKSALTDQKISVPKNRIDLRPPHDSEIPITYVPARNSIFLSYSLAYSEVIGADDIFIGVNAVDYSGYPDCRIQFINAFEQMANLATARANLANPDARYKIHAPLINLSKAEIIKIGLGLGADYSLTHSCYDPVIVEKKVYACGACDSCYLRLKGFRENGISDPSEYI